jgi:DNA (cytosine-5)-methyltransferase 1
MEELTFFNYNKIPLKIDKPIRLIELFSGIGAQAKALERLGADFEHYRVCEFDKYAIKSYNAIHGTKFETSDITKLTAKDLGIVDTDKYCYIMTYSFPCQDLSLAGKQKGMARGSNTRSGLLWEVERLLNECDELPQILLMENVTQVHGTKNKEHFQEWIDFLESKGYSNYWEDLNAKNYGIPQNRNRTFMVSVLGDYTYEFPQGFPLQLRLKHMLEECVDEKYYISDKGIEYIVKRDGKTVRAGGRGSVDRHSCDLVAEPKCKVVGMLSGGKWDKLHDISRRVHSGDGVAPTIHTSGGGQQEPKVVEPFIAASRGRNPDNPSDRTPGAPTEQRLEPNFSGCSNTLTTVQKDNYVVEPRVIGGIGEKKSNGGTQWYQQDRIYDNEIAISVTTGFLPYYKTAEPLAYDEQNGYIRTDGTVGTLTTDGSSPKHNNRVIVPEATKKGYAEAIEGDSINLEHPNSKTRRGRVGHGVAQTLTTAPQQAVFKPVRIRKLTPRECWRLMGFYDEDFNKAAEVNSDSQLYKQAGNSIVVDVLAHIFTQML